MNDSSGAALRGALGLAMKAGRLRSGNLAAETALKNGRAQLAVIDCEASDNTKKHWSDMCRARGVPMVEVPQLGRAIGRESHMTAVITDPAFAGMILNKLNKNPDFGG